MIQDGIQFAFLLRAAKGKASHMTPAQFKAAIASVGLTQEGAARFFATYPRAGQAWAIGEKPVPYMVGWTLEYMVANGIRAEDVRNG